MRMTDPRRLCFRLGPPAPWNTIYKTLMPYVDPLRSRFLPLVSTSCFARHTCTHFQPRRGQVALSCHVFLTTTWQSNAESISTVEVHAVLFYVKVSSEVPVVS
jgi:hypothetical protein